MAGKLLVVFEDLETMGRGEWETVNARLKRQITSNKIMYEGKGKNAYGSRNINNYMMNCNGDVLKEEDGRRHAVMDISAYKKDDQNYWNYMHDKCFNKEVGEAFYNYLNEKDLTNFNDKVVPLSVGKKDAISNRLDLISKFIKYNYVLKKSNS